MSIKTKRDCPWDIIIPPIKREDFSYNPINQNTNYFKPKTVNIITDGSKIGNNDKATVAGVITYTDINYNTYTYILEPRFIQDVTNSEAELAAISYSLVRFNDWDNNAISGRCDCHEINRINIFTDSIYALSKIRPWIGRISHTKYITKDIDKLKAEVNNIKNDFLCIALMEMINSYYSFSIYHIKAHTTDVNYIENDFIITNYSQILTIDAIKISSILSSVDHLLRCTGKNF